MRRCLLRAAFFLKICFVAGGRDVTSYSIILGVYLMPYALFFTMNSALVVNYADAVAKARRRRGDRRSFASSQASRVSRDAASSPKTGLVAMTVVASLIYGIFVGWLALSDGIQDAAPKPLRWFYLLWTCFSDVVICGLVKLWGDRFMASVGAGSTHRAGQFEVLNIILCLALFGHAVYAILSYAQVLPKALTYIYFLGNHRKLSLSRTAIFIATECVPVAAYCALFRHIPEKQARQISVDSSYVPLPTNAEDHPSVDGAIPPPNFAPVSPAIDVRSQANLLAAAHDGTTSEQSCAGSPASLAFSGTPSSLTADQALQIARTRAALAAPQEGVNAISPHEILQSYGKGRKKSKSPLPRK